jgi:AAA+ superfamily predicted ATPase
MLLYVYICRSKKYSFVEKTNVRFSDVKGNQEAIDEMRDLVDYLKNPKKYQELSIKIPKGQSLFLYFTFVFSVFIKRVRSHFHFFS